MSPLVQGTAGMPPVQAVVTLPVLIPPITGATTTREETGVVGGFAWVAVGAAGGALGGTVVGVAGVAMVGWSVPGSWCWSWFSSLVPWLKRLPRLIVSSKKEMSWKDSGLVSSSDRMRFAEPVARG